MLTIEVEHVRREQAADCIMRLRRMRIPLLGAVVLPVISDRYAIRPVQGPPRGAAQGRDNGRSHGEFTGTPAPSGRTRDGHGDPADRVTRH